MRKLIFVVFLLFSSTAFAGATVQMFKVTGDDTSEGFRVGGDFTYGTAGFSIGGDNASIDVGVGKSFGALRVNLGVIQMVDGQREHKQMEVNSTPVIGSSRSGKGVGFFAEIKYKLFFARHVRATLERDYTAKLQVGVNGGGFPIYAESRDNGNEEKQYTMIGLNFPF